MVASYARSCARDGRVPLSGDQGSTLCSSRDGEGEESSATDLGEASSRDGEVKVAVGLAGLGGEVAVDLRQGSSLEGEGEVASAEAGRGQT